MTFFQQKVYRAVKRIPKGEVLSYKQVARLIGSPKAFRAVGNALNKNSDPAIPCHRVVKTNGEIGGYRKGSLKKTSLLRREGVLIVGRDIQYTERCAARYKKR